LYTTQSSTTNSSSLPESRSGGANDIILKLDSGASRCMSGVPGRLHNEVNVENQNIYICGYDNSTKIARTVGLNDDNKIEYYVPGMPKELVLLSAHQYTEGDGIVVLMEDTGFVLQLTPEDRKLLQQKLLENYTVTKRLKVVNRTYELENADQSVSSTKKGAKRTKEEARSAVATRYFNSKVNVSNSEERVLSLLLSGLNIDTLRMMYGKTSEENPISDVAYGLPRDITIKDINRYERLYGSTPEVLQQALPNKAGNVKGYLRPIEKLVHVGQRIEADIFYSDYNEAPIPGKPTTQKIPTLGGAIAAYLSIDCYSGYPHGFLLKNVANIVDTVKESMTLINIEVPDVKLGTFCSDVGIITQSEYRVMTPAVHKYITQDLKMNVEVAEGYNHNNGLSTVESTIRNVKELIRFGILYILNNPNYPNLRITKRQIIMMWGELFHWALWIIRLRECTHVPGKTKYEVYWGKKPDLLKIRLLPIFAFVHMQRHIKKATDNPLGAKRSFWQRGLYVGPAYEVNGAIRVAIRDKRGNIRVIPTTDYKGVSDGGRELVIYELNPNLIQPTQAQPTPTESEPSSHGVENDEDSYEEHEYDNVSLPENNDVPLSADTQEQSQANNTVPTVSNTSNNILDDQLPPASREVDMSSTDNPYSDSYDFPTEDRHSVDIPGRTDDTVSSTAVQTTVDSSPPPSQLVRPTESTQTRHQRSSKKHKHLVSKPTIQPTNEGVPSDVYRKEYSTSNRDKRSTKRGENNAQTNTKEEPPSGITTRSKRAIKSYSAHETKQDSKKKGTRFDSKRAHADHIAPIKSDKSAHVVPLTVRDQILKAIGSKIASAVSNPTEIKFSQSIPTELTHVNLSPEIHPPGPIPAESSLHSSINAKMVAGSVAHILSSASADDVTENNSQYEHQNITKSPSMQIVLDEIANARVLIANSAIEWSEHSNDDYYQDPVNSCYYVIDTATAEEAGTLVETGYKAVTVGVPKTVEAALSDLTWGDATRQEISTLKEITGTLVKANQAVAREDIANGANCLMILMVFEEKMKEGKLVRKVRMVADGRRHTNVGETYSPTPSREEFLIYMHLCAVLGWNYYWLDENRAFLSADRQDQRKLYAKFPGDKTYYEVNKALYGTKDGPRDYGIKVESVLKGELKFTRLLLCSCIYVEWCDDKLQTIIYDHVDDFIFSGSSDEHTLAKIAEFRKFAKTEEPILNAPLVLGMELERNFRTHTIEIRMSKKITELYDTHSAGAGKKIRKIPMQVASYVVTDNDIAALPELKQRFLAKQEIKLFMAIVGSLIWIQGIRFDILFAVLYLSWHTHAPRQHHLDVAYHVIGYLNFTHSMPLVLGGTEPIQGHHFWDSSHATGPKSCGITGLVNKLGYSSGAISAKATKQKLPNLSSFENELVGSTSAFKNANRVNNILTEIHIPRAGKPIVYNDNKAVLEFIRGNSISKGSRHMELRQWYTRLEYKAGKVGVDYLKGTLTPADKLTKPSVQSEHIEYTNDIQGLNLLEYDYFKSILPHEE